MHGRIVECVIPNKESRSYRCPLGVVAVISLWNFSFHLTQRSIAPTLALGNAVVVEPTSDTPVTGGVLIAKVFEEAGLPPDELNVIVGAGSQIGDEFVSHPIPSLISFTGSSIARILLAKRAAVNTSKTLFSSSVVPTHLVLTDADLKLALHAAVVGKCLQQGQLCMVVNRINIEESIYDEFPPSSLIV
ncbi:aldehyde dehydrogenase family protein [Pseudomonas fortuita]|uniref:aldehyde dehydrogenase family protein n=1 Tax=Pseudomonas fortuita TaxID=3233375 RepID=UPI003D9FD9A1